MRKTILTAAASAAITAALCFASVGGAEAMTPGSASGVRAALAQTNLTESVARCYRPCPGCALVCRRGSYGGFFRDPPPPPPFRGGAPPFPRGGRPRPPPGAARRAGRPRRGARRGGGEARRAASART